MQKACPALPNYLLTKAGLRPGSPQAPTVSSLAVDWIMQLPGDREAMHLPLGRGHETTSLYRGLDVESKLRTAVMWQQCCQQQASACQSVISRLYSNICVCISRNLCDVGPCEGCRR